MWGWWQTRVGQGPEARPGRLTPLEQWHRSKTPSKEGFMRRLLFLLFACVPCLAWAGQLADIEIYDRNEARVLPVHEYQGRLYVVGEARHEYELRIRNRSTRRLLAVTSVDGVNVVSGQTAA